MYLSTHSVAAAATTITTSLPLPDSVDDSIFETIISIVKGDGDSQLQRWSSLIGIVTAIVGNVLISFALNIQRYAHIRLNKERDIRRQGWKSRRKNGFGTTTSNGNENEEEETSAPDDSARDENEALMSSFTSHDTESTVTPEGDHIKEASYLKSPYWWAGLFLMTVGETGNFLAYGFAPASIVSPLGVVALISNCVIAPIMLRERFRWRDFWGVVIAIGGAVTVVLSAKQEEKKLGPHEVIGAITQTAFEVYMGITILMIFLLMWASPRYGNRTILIDLGLVGLFGAYTVLSTKGVASMLSATLWKAFATPVTYPLIVILVVTALMQVKYVNKALQRFDSTQVIPVQFVMFTLSVIIGSAVLYRDFEHTTSERAAKFIGGCSLTFAGVWCITSGRDGHHHDGDAKDESDDEAELRISLAEQEPGFEALYQDAADKYGTVKQLHPGLASDEDVIDDEEIVQDASRRSSHVSFVSNHSRPETPKHYSHNPLPPSIKFIPSTDSASSLQHQTSPLVSSTWRSSQGESTPIRPIEVRSTLSTPVLPSGSTAPADNSVISRPDISRAASQGHPHTHPNLQHDPSPPQADAAALGPISHARHSLSRSMLPGPFISPLSSPLSAIVADTVRRSIDSPAHTRRSLRRSSLALHNKGFHHAEGQPSTDEEGQSSSGQHYRASLDAETRDTGPLLSNSLSAEPNRETRSRARSLSHILGDFFTLKRQKSENEDALDDGPESPSNDR